MEWITKQYNCCRSDADVTIGKSKCDDSTRKPQYNIRFKNSSYKSITHNLKVVYAFSGSRVYFKQGNDKEGFKLTNFSVDEKRCSLSVTVLKDEFIGDYPLLYDGKEKLYYIDSNSKINY